MILIRVKNIFSKHFSLINFVGFSKVQANQDFVNETRNHIENNYKNVVKIEEPLPIESNVSVDFSSLTTGKSADDELFDLSDLVEEKPKKTRRKKQA